MTHCDVVHGHQQLSLFNAHYDERCFLPIHVYDTATSTPGGGAAAHRHDTVRCGDPRPSAADGAPYPQPLAEYAADHSWRWPLRPS